MREYSKDMRDYSKFVQITSAVETFDDGSAVVLLFGLTAEGAVYQAQPGIQKNPKSIEWVRVGEGRNA